MPLADFSKQTDTATAAVQSNYSWVIRNINGQKWACFQWTNPDTAKTIVRAVFQLEGLKEFTDEKNGLKFEA